MSDKITPEVAESVRDLSMKLSELGTKSTTRESVRELLVKFLDKRYENANNLEGAKSRALTLLMNKINDSTRPELLLEIVKTLDLLTGQDIDRIAGAQTPRRYGTGRHSSSQRNDFLDLIASKSTTESPLSDTGDLPRDALKIVSNIVQAVELIKRADERKSEDERSTEEGAGKNS